MGAERSNKSEMDDEKARANVPEARRYLVSDLLAGEREIILEHGGAEYRLRITSNGRLILTK